MLWVLSSDPGGVWSPPGDHPWSFLPLQLTSIGHSPFIRCLVWSFFAPPNAFSVRSFGGGSIRCPSPLSLLAGAVGCTSGLLGLSAPDCLPLCGAQVQPSPRNTCRYRWFLSPSLPQNLVRRRAKTRRRKNAGNLRLLLGGPVHPLTLFIPLASFSTRKRAHTRVRTHTHTPVPWCPLAARVAFSLRRGRT